MTRKVMQLLLVAALSSISLGVHAEDIDLFVGPSSGGSANVLILLDNTSNWNAANQGWPGGVKQGQSELNALKTVINSLAPVGQDADINVGLMMLTDVDSKPSGGYVRSAMKPMTSTNRAAFAALMDSIYANFSDPSEMVGSSMDYDKAMFEVFKYFGGYTSPSNANTNVAGAPESSTHFGPLRFAEADSKTDSAAFVDPIAKITYNPASVSDDLCPRKNYLIFIGNGFPNATDSDGEPLLANVGGNVTQIYNESPANKNRYTDEWARFLYQTDVSPVAGKQNVITYTINVYKDRPSAEQGRLLTSMAVVGGGTPFVATSAAEIEDALKRIFSEIQSVNTAFASASLPVSVNTQGTYLNQIFIGMFRPETDPRWYGNLKQYQFKAEVDGSGNVVGLKTVDKNNVFAINPINGFVTPCAVSFWSTNDTYWPDGYQGNCLNTDLRSNAPDGEIVEKGGAAQKLRALSGSSGASARTVKTCIACGDNSPLDSFVAGISSNTAFGVGTNTERTTLINWARGQNLANELSKGTDAMRPSVHGDVVHSRPLAIDYGGTTGVVVFYGGNDGMLRAINGNKPDSAGNELWSFVAPEHYSKLKRLKNNSPAISFPDPDDGSVPVGSTPKDYFFDGPIGIYRSGSSVWIYPTMRRGGSSVYAFNVSSPGNPTLKWRRDGNQLTNLGQTWSEPRVVKTKGYPSVSATTKTPVIIMGGGYDPCEDQDAAPNTACTSPKGNRIFVLNADTGDLLNALATERSVPADVTVVDEDGDGLADYAYAVDTGANIYRINIGTSAPGSWTINKVAALGCSGSASCDRKFLHAPEVVIKASFNAIFVGSGNRERPLLNNQATNVDNAFFMIKDDRSVSPEVITIGGGNLVSINPDVALTPEQEEALALETNKGWYLAFGDGDHSGEQVVTSAAVIAGVVYFSTHMPTVPTSCGANLGTARGYAVNYLDASSRDPGSRFAEFAGGGLPPSPVAGVVEVAVTNQDGMTRSVKVPFVIGGKDSGGGGAVVVGQVNPGGSPIGGQKVNVDVSGVRSRVYWHIQQ